MMGWYIAYAATSLVCMAGLIHNFLRESYYMRLGELTIIVFLSCIPFVNCAFILFLLSRCDFWDSVVWGKSHD